MDRSTIAPSLPDSLRDWGWDETWQAAFKPLAENGLVPARVVAQHRGRWLLAADGHEISAGLTGRLRRIIDAGGELPVVGDWVGVEPPVGRNNPTGGVTRIEAVLARRSAFRRRAAGPRLAAQVVASNVDTLLLATSLNHDLNVRRLERYLAMARESGAEPVVLLTKVDLVEDPSPTVDRLTRDLGVQVTGVSALAGLGLGALDRWLRPGRTVAMVGSSGVGKSTLLNSIVGSAIQATLEVRDDDGRGRHATTHRELFRLPSGGLMIDTPGVRELGLWDAEEGIESTFSEITDLTTECRFSNCRHDREPGCAVRAALLAGQIDARRLKSYQHLAREAAEGAPATRREANKRFSRMVRDAAVESQARKNYVA